MLERLAGRLKWERTSDGIRVVIPERFNWIALGKGLWEPCFYMLIFFLVEPVIRSPHEAGLGWNGWLAMCAMFFALWFLGSLFPEKIILTLNRSMMIIQRRSFGIKRSTSKYSTDSLNNLRFVSASNREEIRNEYRQSEIQIDQGLKTHPFAEGIAETEARALIEKMMEVYNFPKEPVH
ncbi:MAG: hypothetical protein ABSC76_11735 [Terracidiphilus sp.]|jgi:hypothetical protein